jgi:hypothetical protein
METIIQAINKAMLKGVFNLDEAAIIIQAIDQVNEKLSCAEDCKTKTNN